MADLGTHTLRHAIEIVTRDASSGAENFETLKPAGFSVAMRRPKAKDLKLVDSFDGKEIAGSIAMIAALTTLDPLEVENLDAEDFAALGNLLAEAMPSGPPTGATVSAI